MEAGERPSKIRKLNSDDYAISRFPFSNESKILPDSHQVEREVEGDKADGLVEDVHHAENTLQTPLLSKNQMKKLRRKQQWDAGRDDRKAKKKEKLKQKREQKKADKEAGANEVAEKGDASLNKPSHLRPPREQLPVTFVVDCDFDELMTGPKIISLASQITRCYSDNHQAPFRAHMAISSFGGQLKTRFETVLSNHHKSWKGVRVLEDDFVATSEKATKWMAGPGGGEMLGSFAPRANSEDRVPEVGEVVYLTSDSQYTLTELRPYSTYIIGGLVDKNRHKGICYKRAMDRGVRTAKLPIKEFMEMNSRLTLTTNQAYEILVRWLELGDWGEAFTRVMPRRKGAVLKGRGNGQIVAKVGEGAEDEPVEEGAEGDDDDRRSTEVA